MRYEGMVEFLGDEAYDPLPKIDSGVDDVGGSYLKPVAA